MLTLCTSGFIKLCEIEKDIALKCTFKVDRPLPIKWNLTYD